MADSATDTGPVSVPAHEPLLQLIEVDGAVESVGVEPDITSPTVRTTVVEGRALMKSRSWLNCAGGIE